MLLSKILFYRFKYHKPEIPKLVIGAAQFSDSFQI